MIKIEKKVKKHHRLRWLSIIIGVILIRLFAYGAWYVNDYYKADSSVAAYLQSNEKVTVEENYNIIFFKPTEEKSNVPFIFYPGGKVEYTAYAPALKKIAEEGYFVALPKMTFNLAILSSSRADEVIAAYPNYEKWAIGGHSLGGATASDYAFEHQDKIKGIVYTGQLILLNL